jgi:hypothetical protein
VLVALLGISKVEDLQLGQEVPNDLQSFDGMRPWFVVSFGEHGEHASFIKNYKTVSILTCDMVVTTITE